MNKPAVLVIDDEPQIQKLLEIALESNDYKVLQAETGKQGISLAASHHPEMILLDLRLPDKDGREILRDLRTWYQKPIIILSVQDSESEIVSALDNGATDYLTKPFRTAELLARIRSALRRTQTEGGKPVIVCGDLEIDLVARSVRKGHELIKLTATEYNLRSLFARNEGRVLTHQFLLREIWGVGHQTDTQYLRVFVGTLRKKIEQNPDQPAHLITESGVGYRFQ